MQTLILILTCFSASFAFALLLAGWTTLIAVEDTEFDEIVAGNKLPPNTGFLRMLQLLPKIEWQINRAMMARLPAHWRTRQSARVMIFSGLACLVFTVIGISWLTVKAARQPTPRDQPPRTRVSPVDSQ